MDLFSLTKYVYFAVHLGENGESGEERTSWSGIDDGGEKIFSKTTRKLPVQLNRKQYENLFESFDYTKERRLR